MVIVKSDWVRGNLKVVVSGVLSVNPKDMKKLTKTYSIRRASTENNTMAVNPLGAVHLKIKRFQRFSVDMVTHRFDSRSAFNHFTPPY